MKPQDGASAFLSPESVDRWRQRIRTDTFSNYHHKMGLALACQGDTAAAVAALRRAIEADPTRFASSIVLAQILEGAGSIAAAAEVMAAARRLDPDAEALGLIGCAADDLEQGLPDVAEERLRRALALNPKMANAAVGSILELAVSRVKTGQSERAREWLPILVSAPADAIADMGQFGYLLFTFDDYDGAERALRAAVAAGVSAPITLNLLGQIERARLRLDAAYGCFQRIWDAPTQGTFTPFSALLMGNIHQLAGRWDRSLDMFAELEKRCPGNPYLPGFRALSRAALGDQAGAEAEMAEAERALPGHAMTGGQRGILALWNGRPDLAAGYFADEPSYWPMPALGRIGLAVTRLVLGDEPGARRLVAAAAASEPIGIAMTLRILGRQGEALLPLVKAEAPSALSAVGND